MLVLKLVLVFDDDCACPDCPDGVIGYFYDTMFIDIGWIVGGIIGLGIFFFAFDLPYNLYCYKFGVAGTWFIWFHLSDILFIFYNDILGLYLWNYYFKQLIHSLWAIL